MSLRFVSLFSGCGGLDLGFIQAGFDCIAAYDIDRDAVATYIHNIGNHIKLHDLTNIEHEIVTKVMSADVLIAGPPCQGFSTVGKNEPEDTRNSLLLNVAEIAIRAKPKFVVIENVRGLLGPKYANYWSNLLEKLLSAGYKISTRVVEATEFGVAQSRRRVIVLAVLDSQPIDMVFPKVKAKTLRNVLSNLEGTTHHTVQSIDPNSDVFRISKHIKPGQKLSNVRGGEYSIHTWQIPLVFGETSENERLLLETLSSMRRKNRRRQIGDADPVLARDLGKTLGFPVSAILSSLVEKGFVRKIDQFYDLTNAFNGKFRRLTWDKPAPTVDTRFGQPRFFLHPDESRGFSVREAARIQGFPDTFNFLGSEQTAYRLIGNAVPPPMAKAIAKLILKSSVRSL